VGSASNSIVKHSGPSNVLADFASAEHEIDIVINVGH